MTIAAGFKCDDGIVVCADSEETNNYNFKRSVVKVELKPETIKHKDDPVAIFTGSGESVFIDELIEKMWGAAEASWRKTFTDVIGVMERANREYHQMIWSMYPSGTQRSDLPSADLIIALWTQDGCGLYETKGVSFKRAGNFATVGIGDYLAHYICDSAHLPIRNCARTVILANYMLDKVKDHVPGCGGPSHIAVLTNNGGSKRFDVMQLEKISRQMSVSEGLVRQILLTSADVSQSDEHFKAVVAYCERELLGLRAQTRVEVQAITEIWQRIDQAIREAKAERI